MRLLLDTHIAIWALADSARLSERARELIRAPSNEIFVSVVSLWEIAIKRAAGRQDVPNFTSAEAVSFFERAGYQILDVKAVHAAAVESLQTLHRDPFDRLLIAQALTEPLLLVTHDATVGRYGDHVLLV